MQKKLDVYLYIYVYTVNIYIYDIYEDATSSKQRCRRVKAEAEAGA